MPSAAAPSPRSARSTGSTRSTRINDTGRTARTSSRRSTRAARAEDSRPPARGRRRLGLAFGGGLPFGVSSIGVLEVLEREGLPIDCIAGTSMGSIVGLLYAYGYKTDELIGHFAQFFAKRNLLSVLLHDVRVGRTGFVQGNHIMQTLARLVPEDVRFEDLRIPLAVPAADLLTGQEVVFHKGPVLPAVRASISMPGIFTPVPWCGTYLVDGAVISPIPLHLLPWMGADVCIPVRAIRGTGVTEKQRFADANETSDDSPGPAPDILRLMWRSLSLILQDQFSEHLMQQCDIAIRPEIPADMAGSADQLEAIVAIGRAEAEKHVPALRRALGGGRRPAATAVSNVVRNGPGGVGARAPVAAPRGGASAVPAKPVRRAR